MGVEDLLPAPFGCLWRTCESHHSLWASVFSQANKWRDDVSRVLYLMGDGKVDGSSE
jgi:hypothetical protein